MARTLHRLGVSPHGCTSPRRPRSCCRVCRQGLIEGWRDELYPAVQSFHDEPAFLIERAAAPHFGIKAYGGWVVGCCFTRSTALVGGAHKASGG